MRIRTKKEREAALPRIYQAALLGRVAVITSAPRGPHTESRSVVVADVETDHRWIDHVVRTGGQRLVGFYQLGTSHAELLSAISEDLEEAAHAAAAAA